MYDMSENPLYKHNYGSIMKLRAETIEKYGKQLSVMRPGTRLLNSDEFELVRNLWPSGRGNNARKWPLKDVLNGILYKLHMGASVTWAELPAGFPPASVCQQTYNLAKRTEYVRDEFWNQLTPAQLCWRMNPPHPMGYTVWEELCRRVQKYRTGTLEPGEYDMLRGVKPTFE